MPNIYEITGDIRKLWDLMEEGELDDDMIFDAMMNSQEELAIKLEGYCKWIKNMESDIEGLKKEEDRLYARRKSMENTITRAKQAMQMAMNEAGEKKMECGTFKVGLQRTQPSVQVDEQYIENIPSKYLVPQEPKINRKLMLEDLKNGEDLGTVAHLVEGESLRIR